MTILIKKVDYITEKEPIQTIRINVFQAEQGVDPALEFDQYDETSCHLLAYLNQQPVGTVRFRYVSEETGKIERLAVLKVARGQGIGLQLMMLAIELIQQEKKAGQIVIHAQAYVKSLYEKLGFKIIGKPFEEAGIPHFKMILKL
ncbi:MAG: GNAT family N-acetyltransferase [Microcystaceae cyanobacterium]